MTEKSHVGIIGLGRMGKRHLEAYLRITDVSVEACCDAKPGALDFLNTRGVHCKKYSDWHKMLHDESFDLLSIVTNGPTHAEITIEAAQENAPRIICEKPMATSIRAAMQMIETTQKSGTRLAINYSRRWSKDYFALKEQLQSGVIGKLCEMHFVCGGGLLACNGSHFFDLMRFLSGSEPNEAVGFIDKTGTPNPRGAQFTDPGGYGLVKFQNQMRCIVDMNEDLGIPPRIEIVGSIGRVLIDEVKNVWTIASREGNDRSAPLGKYDLPLSEHPIASEPLDPTKLVELTIRQILGKGEISCTGADGLASLQMVMAFHASDREGNIPVPLPLPDKYYEMAVNFT
jgi:predicted dehydrogenase